jgi:4-hydroxythreonine-4-phosphate dehydrogenase
MNDVTERIALVMGDPAGIGPELMAKLLDGEGAADRAAILIIGDRRVLAEGERVAGVRLDVEAVNDQSGQPRRGRLTMIDTGNLDPAAIRPGEVSEAAGRSALDNFTRALDLAREGRVDAITFVPFNKDSLRRGGNVHEDELSFAANYLGATGRHGEFNVVDRLWNARVTSHVPLREVASLITQERVIDRLQLTDETMRQAGFEPPRIAVAALNPHAGDGGAFGREDMDVIAPAVARARDMGMHVDGPFPSDTVFLRARDGHYDAVLTMYHDQGQIAIKLLGFDKGVTVLAGLPVPITTPAHGTAFDIVGKGIANPEPTRRAFELACRMAQSARLAAE